MGFQLNIKNKITVNAVFKTTISVVIGTTSVVGAVVFCHRHEWPLMVLSVAVSAAAWLRAVTGVPLPFLIFAWCGGTVEYEEPTPHGIKRTRLSDLPDTRVGAAIVLGCAAVAMVVALVPGVLQMAARATSRAPSQTTPMANASSSGRGGHHKVSNPIAVIEEYYAAVNKHDWLLMWRLAGNDPARAYDAAYNHMISGYRCTIHDQITAISSSGDAVLVGVRAREGGGAINTEQTYQFSYVVQDGLIENGVQLAQAGSSPAGCRR